MPRSKPRMTAMAPDGAGGMAEIPDMRFEGGDWPFQYYAPPEQAESWLQYLNAEARKHDWNCSGVGQMDARENSGSVTIRTGGPEDPQIGVVWERKRGGQMKIRARQTGKSELDPAEFQPFLDDVNEHCQSGETEQYYRRGQLHYDGLPFCGELWLDESLRLGPPTKQDETALLGPRVILVDALIDSIGRADLPFVFGLKLQELSAFLSVAIGIEFRLPAVGRVWVFNRETSVSEVRDLGYIEEENSEDMPHDGTCSPIPLYEVIRPDSKRRGIEIGTKEISLPSDITNLWEMFCSLDQDHRRQFLQAGSAWQQALSHWSEESTLSYALMVVACEALKPPGPQHRDSNIYDVVEALLGTVVAEQLQEQWFRPQGVRNSHLHAGEFSGGGEFVKWVIMSSYHDPTFDDARRALAKIAQASIMEWLILGGEMTMPGNKMRIN